MFQVLILEKSGAFNSAFNPVFEIVLVDQSERGGKPGRNKQDSTAATTSAPSPSAAHPHTRQELARSHLVGVCSGEQVVVHGSALFATHDANLLAQSLSLQETGEAP